MKLHIFESKIHQTPEEQPAILFLFGGGWKQGDPSQFYPHCEYFASRGLVAISAEYRIRDPHGASPKECVKDAKSAVRWVRKNANKLGIDPNQLIVSGGSAGGHLAAATGALDGFNEKNEDTSISCLPNALVLFNPVFDNGPGGYGFDRVEAYWKFISPRHNLKKTTPPTTVFLGTSDHLVPV